MRARTMTPGLRWIAMGVSAVLLSAGLTVATDAAAPLAASAAQDPTVCQGQVALTNGAFEQPVLTGTNAQLDDGVVPGWSTTDAQKKIEIWRSGFLGVPSAQGSQFAELNATSTGMLYQDVPTTPGQTLSWSLKHRARQGTDVMRVVIGVPGGTLVQSGGTLSDTTAAWGSHTGTYTVPAGQTTTRFGFQAVSTGSGNNSVGNFLDDITFGTGPCAITTKAVTNLTRGGTSAEVGDVLRYSVTTRNDGGNPATQSVSTDALDQGLEFVPGSIRIVSGPGAGSLTDAAADDRGEYLAASRTVQVRLGDAADATAGGSIAVGASTTYTFDATVGLSAAGGTVLNDAQLAFHDTVVDQNRTAVSNETVTPVGQAADLAITKTLDTAELVAGEPASFTIDVTNNGPHAATGVTVTDALPAGLQNVQVTSTQGTCTGTATVTCTIGALAVGAHTTIVVSGTVSPSFEPGAALTNTARVTGTLTDPVPENNTATASGTTTASADVSIVKTFLPDEPVAGGDVSYTLTVRNDGPSEARDVRISDPLDPETEFVGATAQQGSCDLVADTVDCLIGTLAPGATTVVTIQTSLGADAVAAVQNSATVTTSTNDPDPTNNVDSTSFNPTIVADLAVTKSASVSEVAAGQTFTYTIVVRNNGSSDAVNAVLDDTLPEGLSLVSVAGTSGSCAPNGPAAVRCTWAQLDEGASATVTVVATVDSGAPAGTLVNTASVASPAEDSNPANNSASAEVEVVQEADVRVQKLAAGDPVPGEEYTYTLVVGNDGPSLARGVTLTDTLPAGFAYVSDDGECDVDGGSVVCALGDLAPETEVQVHIVGTWDAAATGTVSNTAVVESATPDPDPSNNTSTVDKELTPAADLSVTKTTGTPSVPLNGEVTFEITVRNDGPSAAAGVVVAEYAPAGLIVTAAVPSTGSWSSADQTWTVGTLQPDDSATLTVTADVVLVGPITNTTTVSSPTPDPDPSDNTDTETVTGTASADLSITKTASASPVPVNGALTYTITVTNDGPSVATAVRVVDPLPAALLDPSTGNSACAITGAELSCELGTLAVGGTATVTISGTVDPSTTETSLSNTATVTSATPDPDESNNTDTVVTPVVGTPQVELVKTASAPIDANGDGRIMAGDRIDYGFTIHNVGDVTLTGTAISDPLLGGDVDCAAFDRPLEPGASVTCATTSYTLTQADIDAGIVHNEASDVSDSAWGEASDDDEANTAIPAVNGIALQKEAGLVDDVDESGDITPGDTVRYDFTVTNTGTTTLTNGQITDPMLGGDVVCDELAGAALAPGDSVVCAAAEHVITQADIDGGVVDNTAAVVADAPAGTVSDTASAHVDLERSASVVLSKSITAIDDANGSGTTDAGDEVSYSFEVTNTGNTTLSDLVVVDPLLGDGALCEIAGLVPGENAQCGPVTYVLTQQDIENQGRANTAVVEGQSPIGPVADESSVDMTLSAVAAIALTKTAGSVAAGEDGRVGAGDLLDYRFVIRNTGTVVLSDISLDDPLLGGAVECAALDELVLQPGDEVECGPVAYALTQADVDAGTVHNVAAVEGSSVVGPAEDTDEADAPAVGTDAIALLKSAAAIVDANGDGATDAGDTIAYTFTVTNTGTTTLTDVAVSDPRLSGEITCDTIELALGESTVCEGEPAVLTQAEVDAGEIENTATASGVGTGEDPVTAQDTVVSPIQVQPAIALAKTGGDYADANGNGVIDAGDTLQFRFTVTNTGARTLTDIVLSDPKLGGVLDCDIADLAPGAEAGCGPVAYTLTGADVTAGAVVNVATVSGAAGGVIVTAAATATVDLALATTGGVITGLGWALALLVLGALVLLLVRLRRRTTTL